MLSRPFTQNPCLLSFKFASRQFIYDLNYVAQLTALQISVEIFFQSLIGPSNYETSLVLENQALPLKQLYINSGIEYPYGIWINKWFEGLQFLRAVTFTFYYQISLVPLAA